MTHIWLAEYRSIGASHWYIEGAFCSLREAREVLKNLRDGRG